VNLYLNFIYLIILSSFVYNYSIYFHINIFIILILIISYSLRLYVWLLYYSFLNIYWASVLTVFIGLSFTHFIYALGFAGSFVFYDILNLLLF